MSTDNYYQRLGICQSSSQTEVVQAFRALIKQIHPDKSHCQNGGNQNKQATIELLEAYRVLSNAELRKDYDMKHKLRLKSEQIDTSRYFQDSNLSQRDGKWYARCEQCQGETAMTINDIQIIKSGKRDFFVKCWHCGLALSLIQQ